MFTLEIPDQMPTFGDTTIVAQSYLVNQRIESIALPQAPGAISTPMGKLTLPISSSSPLALARRDDPINHQYAPQCKSPGTQ